MQKRRRIAAVENLVRGMRGRPQLVPARQIIVPVGIASEESVAQPVIIHLGLAVVRASPTLELTVNRAEGGRYEMTVPDTPELRAAAFGTVATSMMAGGWIAEQATHSTGYIVVGALAGWWGGARLWNRWMRRSDGGVGGRLGPAERKNDSGW